MCVGCVGVWGGLSPYPWQLTHPLVLFYPFISHFYFYRCFSIAASHCSLSLQPLPFSLKHASHILTHSVFSNFHNFDTPYIYTDNLVTAVQWGVTGRRLCPGSRVGGVFGMGSSKRRSVWERRIFINVLKIDWLCHISYFVSL